MWSVTSLKVELEGLRLFLAFVVHFVDNIHVTDCVNFSDLINKWKVRVHRYNTIR